MQYLKSLSRRTLLLGGLVAALFSGNASLHAGISIPDDVPQGDLTVTVEEQANGFVKFTLSGTAYMQDSTYCMTTTNYSPWDASPPFASYEFFELPEGLTLTVPYYYEAETSAPEGNGPQEIPASTIVIDLDYLNGHGNSWDLGEFESVSLSRGDAMTGAGSITTNAVPFNLFTPGTFFIAAGQEGMGSESDTQEAEGGSEIQGTYPYSITYKVIPLKPSLAVSGPGAFPKTIIRKSSRVQQVKVTNDGSAPLTDLSVSLSGTGVRDFVSSAPYRTNLAAGASTWVDVRFRPKRKGQRSATLTVDSLFTPHRYPAIPDTHPQSVEEDMGEPVPGPVPQPVVVSGSTSLTGKGLARGKNRRPHSPRYPFGRR